MNVGEIAASLRLEDGQFTAAVERGKASITRLASSVTATAARINRVVIAPDHGPFKSFTHHMTNLAHLMELAMVGSFKVVAKEAGGVLSGVSKAAALSVAAVGVALASTVGKSAIEVAGQVEIIKVRLQTLTGSAEEAKKKLAFLDDLAGRSQFKLVDLVDAGTQLEALGIQMDAMLPLVGDLASAMNMDLESAALSVGRALKGIPEGFQVLRNQAGITVEVLQKAGARVNKQGGLDLSDVAGKQAAAQALLKVMERFQGGMERKAEGIVGAQAKVANAIFRLNSTIGEQLAPMYKAATLALARFLDGLNTLLNGLEKAGAGIVEWAASISGAVLAVSGLGMVVGGVLTWLGSLAVTALGAAGKLFMIASVAKLVAGALFALFPAIPMLGGLAGVLGTLASVAAAAKLAIVAVGTVVGGVLLAGFLAASAAIAAFAVAWATDWNNTREKTARAVEWIRNAVVNGFTKLSAAAVELWRSASETVIRLGNRMAQEVAPAADAVVALFEEQWPTIRSIANNTMEAVTGILGFGLRLLATEIKVWGPLVTPVWSVTWTTIKSTVQGAWAVISGAVRVGLTTLDTILKVGLEVFSGRWGAAWDALVDGANQAKNQIVVAIKQALVAALKTVHSFVDQFGLAGKAIGDAIAAGINSQEQGIRRLQTSSAYLGARNPSAAQGPFDTTLQWLANLGKAHPGKPQADKNEPGFDWEKWMRDFLASMGAGDSDDSKQEKKKTSEAEIERQRRLALVQAARTLVGQGVDVNQCAITVRDAAKIAGVDLGLTTQPFDRAALPPGSKVGPGHADSFPGTFFRNRGSVQPGDLAMFHNTSPKFGPGVASHVGIVVEVGPKGIRIVDASASAGQVVERSLESFPAHQQLGFLRPKALGGGAAGGDFGEILAQIRRLDEFLAGANEFASKRLALQQEINEALAAAGATGDPQKMAAAVAEGKRRMDVLTREELRAQEDLAQSIETLHAELNGDLLQQAIERIQTETRTRVRALEDAAEKEPAMAQQISDAIVAIKQHEAERITLAEAAARRESSRLWQELERKRQELADATLDRTLSTMEFERTMGRATRQEQIDLLARELEAFVGSEERKRQGILSLLGLQRQDIAERLQLQEGYNAETLAQEAAFLAAKTDLTYAEQARLAALLDALHQEKLRRAQEEQQVIQQVEGTFQQFLVQTLSGQASFSQTFQNLWKSLANTVIAEIARMIVKTVAFQTILLGLRKLLGGIFGGIFHDGDVVGAPAFLNAPGVAVAHSGGFVGPNGIQRFHSGGPVGSLAGFLGGGLRSDEIPAILQKGEVVLSRAQVRALRSDDGGGRGDITVNVSPTMVQDVSPERLGDILGREMAWRLQGGV